MNRGIPTFSSPDGVLQASDRREFAFIERVARAIYVTAFGRRVVIVRIFVKKSQKTPRRELELARQRAKEVE